MNTSQIHPTDTAMVELLVGPRKHSFQLPEAVLCTVSPFFKAAFQSGFKETTEKVMFLPEDLPEAFSAFACWINGEEIGSDDSHNGVNPHTPSELLDSILNLLSISEKYLVKDLEDQCFEGMSQIGNAALSGKWLPSFLPCDLILDIWAYTEQSSKLREKLRGKVVDLMIQMFWQIDDFSCRQAIEPFREAYVQVPDLSKTIVGEMRRQISAEAVYMLSYHEMDDWLPIWRVKLSRVNLIEAMMASDQARDRRARESTV